MRLRSSVVIVAFLLLMKPLAGDDCAVLEDDANEGAGAPQFQLPQFQQQMTPVILPAVSPFIEPVRALKDPRSERVEPGVRWGDLYRQSALFVGIEHGFRLATEEGTRGAKGPLMQGYVNSVRNLHGWNDGDPFLVNYIGHPMQGAAAGYIWLQNDPEYRYSEFGRDRRYWKGRLRGAAFSWAYSTQFEIGPISEASIGLIQSRYPQQGFVDHVITPAAGLGWTIAEDAIDRHVILPLENRIANPYVRLLLRGWLNPSRSFANILAGKVPWYRYTRPGLLHQGVYDDVPMPSELEPPDQGIAPFEFTVLSKHQTYLGAGSPSSCLGGGASTAFRVSSEWQIVAEVSGCGVRGLDRPGLTGDSLTYAIGPRWTPTPDRRLRPYLQVLLGGNKLTQDEPRSDVPEAVEKKRKKAYDYTDREEYTRQHESNSLALSAATGLDLKLSPALAFRLASLEYTKTWSPPMSGYDYSRTLQFSLGVTLRMGTW
jgi:hypothetical protein